jgi:hypothetical protein
VLDTAAVLVVCTCCMRLMLGASRIRHAPLVAFGAYENTQIHSLLLRNPANIISSARSALHLHHQRLDSHAPALSLNLSKIAGVLLSHNTAMHIPP